MLSAPQYQQVDAGTHSSVRSLSAFGSGRRCLRIALLYVVLVLSAKGLARRAIELPCYSHVFFIDAFMWTRNIVIVGRVTAIW